MHIFSNLFFQKFYTFMFYVCIYDPLQVNLCIRLRFWSRFIFFSHMEDPFLKNNGWMSWCWIFVKDGMAIFMHSPSQPASLLHWFIHQSLPPSPYCFDYWSLILKWFLQLGSSFPNVLTIQVPWPLHKNCKISWSIPTRPAGTVKLAL